MHVCSCHSDATQVPTRQEVQPTWLHSHLPIPLRLWVLHVCQNSKDTGSGAIVLAIEIAGATTTLVWCLNIVLDPVHEPLRMDPDNPGLTLVRLSRHCWKLFSPQCKAVCAESLCLSLALMNVLVRADVCIALLANTQFICRLYGQHAWCDCVSMQRAASAQGTQVCYKLAPSCCNNQCCSPLQCTSKVVLSAALFLPARGAQQQFSTVCMYCMFSRQQELSLSNENVCHISTQT